MIKNRYNEREYISNKERIERLERIVVELFEELDNWRWNIPAQLRKDINKILKEKEN